MEASNSANKMLRGNWKVAVLISVLVAWVVFSGSAGHAWAANVSQAERTQGNLTVGALATQDTSYPIDISSCGIMGLKELYVYKGKTVHPSFDVWSERCEITKTGDDTAIATTYLIMLERGRDYTVSYKNASKIGTASVVIKGKGDYCGTLRQAFRIVPGQPKGVKAARAKGKLALRCSQVKGGCSYQFAYRTGKGVWKKVLSGTPQTTACKLKAGKTYQIKVRACKKVNGKWAYGRWSDSVNTKIS